MPVINKKKKVINKKKKVTYGPSLIIEYMGMLNHQIVSQRCFEKLMAERIPVLRGRSSLLFFDDNGNDDSIPFEEDYAAYLQRRARESYEDNA